MAMGYDEALAKAAIAQCGGDVQVYATWIVLGTHVSWPRSYHVHSDLVTLKVKIAIVSDSDIFINVNSGVKY